MAVLGTSAITIRRHLLRLSIFKMWRPFPMGHSGNFILKVPPYTPCQASSRPTNRQRWAQGSYPIAHCVDAPRCLLRHHRVLPRPGQSPRDRPPSFPRGRPLRDPVRRPAVVALVILPRAVRCLQCPAAPRRTCRLARLPHVLRCHPPSRDSPIAPRIRL